MLRYAAVTKAVRKTPRVGFLPRRSENETAPDSPARLSFRTHQEGTQRDRIVYRNGPFASGCQRLSKHRNDRHQMVRYGHRSEYNCASTLRSGECGMSELFGRRNFFGRSEEHTSE